MENVCRKKQGACANHTPLSQESSSPRWTWRIQSPISTIVLSLACILFLSAALSSSTLVRASPIPELPPAPHSVEALSLSQNSASSTPYQPKKFTTEKEAILVKTTTTISDTTDENIYIHADIAVEPVYSLVERILPTPYHGHFLFAIKPALIPASSTNVHDTFRISNWRNGAGVEAKILIEGASLAGLGAGLNYYIRNICKVEMSWSGDRFDDMPPVPPGIPESEGTIRASFVPWRYYMNVVTFGYSYVFWDWKRWERELDWMFLNGVNMGLAMVGQEYVFRQMYEDIGLTREELNDFFAGPAYMPWQHMGNIQGSWGFPNDVEFKNDWIDSQWELQGYIMNRMLEFNITAILPSFNGFVPHQLVSMFPDVKFDRASQWNALPEQYTFVSFVPSTEPFFATMTERYIRTQRSMYEQQGLGPRSEKNHYLLDLYNELHPVCSTVECLKTITHGVMRALKDADQNAVWTMQSWFLLNTAIWHDEEIKAFFDGIREVNDGRDAFVIDLYSDVAPLWNSTQGFFGIDWGWSMLNNFGGGQALYGTLPTLLTEPFKGYHQPAKTMRGIGITMEGINNNEYLYQLVLDIPWELIEAIDTINTPTTADTVALPGQPLNQFPLDGQAHLEAFLKRRYGLEQTSDAVIEAWTILSQTVWDISNGQMSQSKATLDVTPALEMSHEGFMSSMFWYNQTKVVHAWSQFVQSAGPEPGRWRLSSFYYDLVDVTREIFVAVVIPGLHKELIEAYKAMDLELTKSLGKLILESISDTDRILATHSHFMLGPWIRDARISARLPSSTSPKSDAYMSQYADYLEHQARNQITWWAPEGQVGLSNYGSKEWAGIVSEFYYPRWEIFVNHLVEAVQSGVELDYDAYLAESLVAETKWQNERTCLGAGCDPKTTLMSEEGNDGRKWYPVEATEDTVSVAQELWARWNLLAERLARKAEEEKQQTSS
ncbi:tim-barrel domain-containing protein [Dissophora ornata]|nr:tim-barrel domain-containing protein [Dissophora ornata]